MRCLTVDGFPFLDLRRVPRGLRVITSFRFVRVACRFLEDVGLQTRQTIIYKGCNSQPIGISPWPVTFPATSHTVLRIAPVLLKLEDRRFFRHRGIDWIALIRALLKNVIAFGIREGGSTLTQQLVRNTFVYPSRSPIRKFVECFLAHRIERIFTKDAILQAYCSLVFLGPGVRGVEAALRLYHRKTSTSASDGEITALVGCLRMPMRTSPFVDSEAYQRRATQIDQFLGRRRAARAPEDRSLVTFKKIQKARLAAIVDAEMRPYLECDGRLPHDIQRVHLTLNPEIQGALDYTCRAASFDVDVAAVAGVIVRSGTGEVLAESSYAEGRETQHSPTFAGTIQPGSLFKPFVLLEALEQGYCADYRLESKPFIWRSSEFPTGSWFVRNYNHIYRGEINLAEALAFSDNAVFARLTQILGIESVAARLMEFGLVDSSASNPSMALGAVRGGVSLVQICKAYAGLATGGVLHEPHLLRGVEFADQSLAPRWRTQPRGALCSYSSLLALRMALCASGIRVGTSVTPGKSGTAGTSNLFAAYDDAMSYAIWVGFRRTRPEWWSKGLSAKSVLGRVLDGLAGRTAMSI